MDENRRSFLKATAGASLLSPLLSVQERDQALGKGTEGDGFRYKVGCFWLPHMGSRPFPNLFSAELDQALIDDYRFYLPQVREAGFDYVSIAGLIAEGAHDQVPTDIERGFSQERDRQIRQIIDLIHGAGLKFVADLGVYSWGFKNIIGAHPEIRAHRYIFRGITDYPGRNNALLLDEYDRLQEKEIEAEPDLMNAAVEESWQWQERVVRFLLKNYNFDGFHLESADLGRCWCPECRKTETIMYHAKLNQRTTGLIKEIAPDKIVGVHSGGLILEGLRDLPALQQMVKGADYYIDASEYYMTVDATPLNLQYIWFNDRPEVVKGVAPVAVGQFIHQRDPGLDRLSWFTPAVQTIVGTIGKAYRDGCRAQEYYSLGAFRNPSKELNNYVAGYSLNHPQEGWKEVLSAVVDRLYRPRSGNVREDLAEFFRKGEISCLANDVLLNMVLPKGSVGMMVTDPTPFPYLYKASLFKQLRYQRELELDFLPMARKLERDLGSRERAQRLVASLEGTIATVQKSVQKHLESAT